MGKAKKVKATKTQPAAKKASAQQQPTALAGHRVNHHEAEAKKSGVRIRLWMKGSKSDTTKAEAHWLVLLPGRGDTRVITPDFDSEAAAKKAALAAGFKVVES
jgi:hypothetical protein